MPTRRRLDVGPPLTPPLRGDPLRKERVSASRAPPASPPATAPPCRPAAAGPSRPCSASRRSMCWNRRVNFALARRSASSGSTLSLRARLAITNRTSPISSAMRFVIAARARFLQFGQFFVELRQHFVGRRPIEIDARGALGEFLGAHQRGQGHGTSSSREASSAPWPRASRPSASPRRGSAPRPCAHRPRRTRADGARSSWRRARWRRRRNRTRLAPRPCGRGRRPGRGGRPVLP